MRKCGGVSNLATAEWGNDGFWRLNNSHRVLGDVAALSGNASSGTGCYTAVEDQTETFGKSDRRRCRILGLGNATPPSVPPVHPRLMPPVYSRFRSPGHNSVAAATYCFPVQPILRRNTPQMMRPWRRLLIPRSRALDRLKATHLHLSATLPSLAEVRVGGVGNGVSLGKTRYLPGSLGPHRVCPRSPIPPKPNLRISTMHRVERRHVHLLNSPPLLLMCCTVCQTPQSSLTKHW